MRGLILLPSLLLAACMETTTTVGGPTHIQLEAVQPTRTLGQAHQFRVEAEGRTLSRIVLEFGSERVDSVQAAGAQSLTHVHTYTFNDVGSFLVRARVEDGTGNVARDSVTVMVIAQD